MPVGGALVLMGDVEHLRFAEIVADQLQSDRQAPGIEAARQAHARQACQVGGNGVEVVQIHFDRVVGFLDELERSTKNGKGEDVVADLERFVEVVGYQAADFLRLQKKNNKETKREHI